MMIKYLLSFFLLFLASSSANALDRFYCKCDSGAQPGCTATTPDTPPQGHIDLRNPGDRYLFCQGGSWQVTSSIVTIVEDETRCVPSCNPRVSFDSYVAGWGGGGTRPRIECTAGGCILFLLGGFFESGMDGGYNIRNLHLTGGGVAGNAAFLTGSISNVTFENNLIEEFTSGFIDINQSDPGTPGKRNANIQILGNTMRNGASGSVACIHGGAEGLLIDGNTFSKCGGCAGTCHTLYLASVGSRLQVSNNYMEKSGAFATGNEICQGGNISIRGQTDQVLVENNVINNSAGVTNTCGGINVKPAYCFECIGNPASALLWDQEYMLRTVIRGNKVINNGGAVASISAAATPYVVIENNLVYRDVSFTGNGIAYPDNREPYPDRVYADIADIGGKIRNNTVIINSGPDFTAFLFNTPQTHGPNIEVVNNIAHFTGAFTGTQSCFLTGPQSLYSVWNNNICFGADRWSSTSSSGGGFATHALAHAAGWDTWSTAGGLADDDPLLTLPTLGNNWNASLTSDSSPAHNTGSNTYKSKFDIAKCSRDTTPSIGAWERGGTPCLTTKTAWPTAPFVVPSGFAPAAPTGVSSSGSTPGQRTITWNAPTLLTNGAALSTDPIRLYKIYWRIGSSIPSDLSAKDGWDITLSTQRSIVIRGLTSGNTVYVAVSATNYTIPGPISANHSFTVP